MRCARATFPIGKSGFERLKWLMKKPDRKKASSTTARTAIQTARETRIERPCLRKIGHGEVVSAADAAAGGGRNSAVWGRDATLRAMCPFSRLTTEGRVR